MGKHFFDEPIEKIEFGTNPNNLKEAVFLVIYSKIRPLLHYDHPKKDRNSMMNAFLLSNRSNNTKGFIGGTVDKGESHIDTLQREIKEEFNLDLDLSKLTSLCSHNFRIVSHTYMLEVSELDFFEILKNISIKENDFFTRHTQFLKTYGDNENILELSRKHFGVNHFFAEIRNIEAVYLSPLSKEQVYLLDGRFSGSGKEDLIHFLKHINEYND